MAKTAVIGAGSWGTALSLVLHTNGNDAVTVWSIVEREAWIINENISMDKLPGVKLPEDITFLPQI